MESWPRWLQSDADVICSPAPAHDIDWFFPAGARALRMLAAAADAAAARHGLAAARGRRRRRGGAAALLLMMRMICCSCCPSCPHAARTLGDISSPSHLSSHRREGRGGRRWTGVGGGPRAAARPGRPCRAAGRRGGRPSPPPASRCCWPGGAWAAFVRGQRVVCVCVCVCVSVVFKRLKDFSPGKFFPALQIL